MDSRESLMSHLGSHRHLGNKRNFAPVFKDNEQQQQRNEPGDWPPTKSRHSRPDNDALPKPHQRIRNEERMEEPWRFSPSEAEQQDRYDDPGRGRYNRMPPFDSRPRTPPMRSDNYDDGFSYNDDFGGGDDYRDDDSPPPAPAPFMSSSVSLAFSLPKPVPIVLPKPVPTSRPPVQASVPAPAPTQPLSTR